MKVVPTNQNNQQPQTRKFLFGKAGELFLEEFSASILNVFSSQGLSQYNYSVTGFPLGLPEILTDTLRPNTFII